MKFVIAGLGSAGQRHVRNLRRLVPGAEFLAWRVRGWNLVINDQLQAHEGKPEDAYDLRVVAHLEDALRERPDAVIVANPISMHCGTALAAARAGAAVFVEKPIADRWDGVEELLEIAQRRLVAVGYQMRFHPVLRRVKEHLAAGRLGRPVSASIHVGEYLPGMHPYEDYRVSHAARRAEGGGVILCLSHEIDIATWLFGMPSSVYTAGGHLSGLELDVEDTARMLWDCRWQGRPLPVALSLDFVQRPPQRRGEVVYDGGTLRWDLRDPSVSVFDAARGEWEVERFDGLERNQLFVDEMAHFLACMAGRETPLVPASAGADVLRIALAAKASLETGRPVTVTAVPAGEQLRA